MQFDAVLTPAHLYSFLTETPVWTGVVTSTTYWHIQGTNHLEGHQKCSHVQQPTIDDAICLFRRSSSFQAMDRSPISAAKRPSTSSSSRFLPVGF